MSLFEQKAPAVMSALMMRFALKDFQAGVFSGTWGMRAADLSICMSLGQRRTKAAMLVPVD